ncbi:hypothetical protein EV644_13816 [Kribbella orskensis]|uniref:Lysylphosphatidylglycerol synthase-like protein n=1 Tax=Kribbella orskensis TaxID=2512216 RepID=A0ABY2B6Z1_9ACTN|nr:MULTISPECIES: YbhN family protein [Kribbella]TCN29629.1 hypothetical protein EV642_14032 [Kribbella sp. VKM Ac-2500]TCO09937.1 hypothetical protein EV644_13816 [Kribbella orskensis]
MTQLAPRPVRTGSPLFAWLRSAAGLLVLIAVVDYFVLPQLAGTQESLHLLGQIRPWWVAVGIVLEAASLVCYSLFTRSVLRSSPLQFGWILRSDLTGFGVSHVVPGGGATATALRFRLLVSGGASVDDVTAAIAAEGVGAWLALAVIFWVALIPAVLLYGPTALYVTVLLIGVLLAVFAAVAVRERSRLAGPAKRVLRFALHRLPRRLQPRVRAIADQLRDLLTERDVRSAFAVWPTANWLLDAAALWVFLAAYGHAMDPVALLLAYCIACLLAVLPITPGGLGVIEGVLIPGLLGFGVPAGVAVLGVVSWRLFQFWAPVLVAGICYLSLRTPGWRNRIPGRTSRPS